MDNLNLLNDVLTETNRIVAKAEANPTRHNLIRAKVCCETAEKVCRDNGRTVSGRTYWELSVEFAHRALFAANDF
jgi:hypothetical protein